MYPKFPKKMIFLVKVGSTDARSNLPLAGEICIGIDLS